MTVGSCSLCMLRMIIIDYCYCRPSFISFLLALKQRRTLRKSAAPTTEDDSNTSGNSSEEEEEEEKDLTADPSTSQPPGQGQPPSGMYCKYPILLKCFSPMCTLRYCNILQSSKIAMAESATMPEGSGPSTSLVTRLSGSDFWNSLMYMHTLYSILHKQTKMPYKDTDTFTVQQRLQKDNTTQGGPRQHESTIF